MSPYLQSVMFFNVLFFLMYFQNFLIGSYFLLKQIGITTLKIQDYLGKSLLFILSLGLSFIF